jgi:DNA-binding IclR family transcriptional regulator
LNEIGAADWAIVRLATPAANHPKATVRQVRTQICFLVISCLYEKVIEEPSDSPAFIHIQSYCLLMNVFNFTLYDLKRTIVFTRRAMTEDARNALDCKVPCLQRDHLKSMPLKSRKTPSPISKPADDQVDARYRAPALDKGLDILELLCSQPAALTRGEIDKALGRRPSEGYRMLERLVARRYVTRSLEGDRYAPSLKLFLMAQEHPPMNRLITHSRPWMEAFAKRAEQSCHLGLYEDGNILIVAETASPGKLSLSVRPGSLVNLVDTGSGHVLLAFQKPENRAQLLATHQPLEGETAISQAELKSRLSRVRANGYWQGDSQHAKGIIDIAVPLLGPDGQAFAALTCPYITRIDHHVSASADLARSLLLDAARGLSMS